MRVVIGEDEPLLREGLALLLSLGGLSVGGVTAWLGGELVDRLGVGVDPGAHLDAPNSLSQRPPIGAPRTDA